MRKKKLPKYKLVVENDSDKVSSISLVEYPAIESNFVAFKKNEEVKFKIQDEDQHIVTGAILIPDFPIYRTSPGGDYLVEIDAATILEVAQKYFKEKRTGNVDLEHDGNLVNDVYMFESFIVDSKRGITAPAILGNIPEGSWIASFKVDNPEIWQQIKDGTFKGFSITGMFALSPEQIEQSKQKYSEIEVLEAIQELLDMINEN